jgi:hypothetical protein
VTDTGGKLIKTPPYKAIDNQQIRLVKVHFKDDGNAHIDLKTTYTGLRQDSPADIKHELDFEAQRNCLYKHLPLQSIEIQQFTFKEISEELPKIEAIITLNPRNRIRLFFY